jgi:hypothetical protein
MSGAQESTKTPGLLTLRRSVSREHLQIVNFASQFRLGDAIEKLANTGLGAFLQILRGVVGHDDALVEHDHAIGDQESAG